MTSPPVMLPLRPSGGDGSKGLQAYLQICGISVSGLSTPLTITFQTNSNFSSFMHKVIILNLLGFTTALTSIFS